MIVGDQNTQGLLYGITTSTSVPPSGSGAILQLASECARARAHGDQPEPGLALQRGGVEPDPVVRNA